MRWPLLAFSLFLAASFTATASVSIEIDLQEQRAYLLRNRRVVLDSPISSGKAGYRTPTGRFKVIEKDRDHRSSIYGKIVDSRGRTLVADAHVKMRLPRGGRFVSAPMLYFIRFTGATGMHAGYLPGFPASHGCVRLPERDAMAFYRAVELGTPVNVFGKTGSGHRREAPRDNREYMERDEPPFRREPWVRRYPPPGWWW